MNKKEVSELIKEIYHKFPKEFNSMSKSEKLKYANEFYKAVGKYDFKLVASALLRIFNMKYPKSPTMDQLLIYVSRMLFERRSHVLCTMQDHAYYEKYYSGTAEEKTEKARWRFDDICVEFLKDRISNANKLEIQKAVDELDYLSEFRGLILFDETLPIPPGCDPNKSWDYSPPTAHQHSHKY